MSRYIDFSLTFTEGVNLCPTWKPTTYGDGQDKGVSGGKGDDGNKDTVV